MSNWQQVYDPLHNPINSTLLAAVPIVLLLVLVASGKVKAHYSAAIALLVALLVAVFEYSMPAGVAVRAAGFGALTGVFPIGWIILNVMFLYRLTVERGWFQVLQRSIEGVTPDRRLQLLLIAFCFGSFFEGAAGFGTPVAITAAMLIGLGFSPLSAAGLSLIANTAPVAFGAMGAPIQALATSTGLDPNVLGMMVGRQVPIFAVIVPFWLIWAFAGFRGMFQVWPAILVAGLSLAIPQFLVSNFVNPWIVDIVASLSSVLILVQFLRVWRPKEVWTSAQLRGRADPDTIERPNVAASPAPTRAQVALAYLPWILLCLLLTFWATDYFKHFANGIFSPSIPIDGLNKVVERMPPVVAKPSPEAAVFAFSLLSYTGTGILVTALLSGLFMLMSPLRIVRIYLQTLWSLRFSLITIAGMLAIGTLTRFSGIDATLGLSFARAGAWYPFFGTLLGWLGVAATGSDTASNVLFGGLQKITAQQIDLSPVLMAAANSSGGVMGKMIDTQSIVVATTATGWYGNEGKILRFVFLNSLVLASLVGGLVLLQAYVWPFTAMVPK